MSKTSQLLHNNFQSAHQRPKTPECSCWNWNQKLFNGSSFDQSLSKTPPQICKFTYVKLAGSKSSESIAFIDHYIGSWVQQFLERSPIGVITSCSIAEPTRVRFHRTLMSNTHISSNLRPLDIQTETILQPEISLVDMSFKF